MGSNDDKMNGLAEEWNEDMDEYDLTGPQERETNMRAINNSNTLDALTPKGYEFETNPESSEAEKDELNSRHHYWTREEILAHLENNPKPEDDICEESDVYDQRIKHMDVILEDGVYKRIIKRGMGGLIPENSAVLYNLNAFLEAQDEPFDSTWLRGRPYLHKLSYDTILPGLCLALLSMRKGERAEIIVRPNYAYLEMGCPPRVPANATILYVVEVIKVFDEGSFAHYETLNIEDRNKFPFDHILKLCDEERISGNSYFVEKRYRESAFRFRRAIRCLEQLTYTSAEEENRAKQLLLKLYSNIANSYNKFQKPFNAMSNCKRALIIDPKNVKVLYQYGLAKMMNADYEDAKQFLCRAKTLKPNNQTINEALQRLDHHMYGDRIVEEELYRKMGSLFNSK